MLNYLVSSRGEALQRTETIQRPAGFLGHGSGHTGRGGLPWIRDTGLLAGLGVGSGDIPHIGRCSGFVPFGGHVSRACFSAQGTVPFFFFFKIFIRGYFLYNFVLVSTIQQDKSRASLPPPIPSARSPRSTALSSLCYIAASH